MDDEIKAFLKKEDLINFYENLKSNKEVKTLIKQANNVSIGRLGLNDHGEMHSKITTRNALKILSLLKKSTIMKEKIGNEDDAKIAVMLSAYLHDIGISINRENHELFSVILAKPIAEKLLIDYYKESKKAYAILPVVLEGILCHMGNYKPTSVEAGIISIADGCDMTKGRARISFTIGDRSIHEYSAMAIDEVNIKKGKEKPVEIEIKMSSAAGVFQVQEILLKKIKNSGLKKYVAVVSKVKERGKSYKDVY